MFRSQTPHQVPSRSPLSITSVRHRRVILCFLSFKHLPFQIVQPRQSHLYTLLHQQLPLYCLLPVRKHWLGEFYGVQLLNLGRYELLVVLGDLGLEIGDFLEQALVLVDKFAHFLLQSCSDLFLVCHCTSTAFGHCLSCILVAFYSLFQQFPLC